MKGIATGVLKFNESINTLASKRPFAVLAIIVLSISSFVTTLLGFYHYTDYALVAICASAGVQLLMLYSAVRIAGNISFHSQLAFWLLSLFFVSMGISSFFSFAAFHDGVETEARRAEEGDTLLRSEWTTLYNGVKKQILLEFRQRADAENSKKLLNYNAWRDQLNALRSEAPAFYESTITILDDYIDVVSIGSENKKTAHRRNIEDQEEISAEINLLRNRQRTFQRNKAALEGQIPSIEEQLAREVDEGGTALEDGEISPAGDGPIARGLRADLQARKNSVERIDKDLRSVTAELEALDKQLKEANSLRNLFREEEQQEGSSLAALDAAKSLVETFKISVVSISAPPDSVRTNNVDELISLEAYIRDAVKLCSLAKQQYQSALGSLENAKISTVENAGISVPANRCDTQPKFGAGEEIVAHISNFRQFLKSCNPVSLSRIEGAASDQDPLARYAQNYRTLRTYFQNCLSEAPAFESATALEGLMERFRSLLLKYNPEAHPFTRAVAAFERADLPALLAALIAIAIDGVILICGLALREKPSTYVDVDDAEYEEIYHREKIDEFVQDNGFIVSSVLAATNAANQRGVQAIDGVENEVYEVHFPHESFSSRMTILREMNALRLLHLVDEMFFITDTQRKDLKELADRFGIEY